MRELRARAVPGGAGWSGSATGARDSRACRAATAACFWTLRECIAQLPFRVDAISRGGVFKPSSVSGNAHSCRHTPEQQHKCRLLGGILGSCGSCETNVRLVLISPSPCFLSTEPACSGIGDQLEERAAVVRSVVCGSWQIAVPVWPGVRARGWGGICRASRHLAEAGAVLP